jgi:hypothetical protein
VAVRLQIVTSYIGSCMNTVLAASGFGRDALLFLVLRPVTALPGMKACSLVAALVPANSCCR